MAGYHSVMSVVLITLMVPFRRTFFPLRVLPLGSKWVMRCNPVTYALVVLRKAFYLVPTQLMADVAFCARSANHWWLDGADDCWGRLDGGPQSRPLISESVEH